MPRSSRTHPLALWSIAQRVPGATVADVQRHLDDAELPFNDAETAALQDEARRHAAALGREAQLATSTLWSALRSTP